MRNLLPALFLLALTSCGSNDRPADCEDIAEACHPFDTGSGPIHDCHEMAEDGWSGAECTSNKAMCLAMCTSSAGADAGLDAASGDAAP